MKITLEGVQDGRWILWRSRCMGLKNGERALGLRGVAFEMAQDV